MSATPPPPAGYNGYSAQPPLSPQDEKLWSTLTHVLGIFFGWISALIIFLVFKDRGPFIKQHSTTELNFQITVVLAYVAATILAVVTFGILSILFFPIWVVQIVFGILAAVKSNQGQPYEYPLAIKFIK